MKKHPESNGYLESHWAKLDKEKVEKEANKSKLEKFADSVRKNKLSYTLGAIGLGLLVWGGVASFNAEYEEKGFLVSDYKIPSSADVPLGHNPIEPIVYVMNGNNEVQFPEVNKLQQDVKKGDSIYIDMSTNTLIPIFDYNSIRVVPLEEQK